MLTKIYCLRCRMLRDVQAKEVVLDNKQSGGKRRAVQGPCSACGQKLTKITGVLANAQAVNT